MGFKTDTSFLRFLTMGALATRHVMGQLAQLGFAPIELERYASSNKIWVTKIKRLRLPDLLCIRTGMRVEVRAKSNLEIRMSHAPSNPERNWDAGSADTDVVALVPCRNGDTGPAVAADACFFTFGALRQSVDPNQLSRLKAASEGSEQHLTWPTIVANRPGVVLDVTTTRLSVEWRGDGKPPRRHTYALNGKAPYVSRDDRFAGETQFLAGTPSAVADLRPYLAQQYDPLRDLASTDRITRYSAAKALAFRDDQHAMARLLLERQIGIDTDLRVALEVANTAAGLGVSAAADFIHNVIHGDTDGSMRMEAIFIVTELGRRGQTAFAIAELGSIAGDRARFGEDEARQAAVWGLGHAGLRAYDKLLPYLIDPEENVALHAVAAFGPDTPDVVILELINGMLAGEPIQAASCSAALQIIGSDAVIVALSSAAAAAHSRRPWIIATLGRLAEPNVRAALQGNPLLTELEPLLLGSSPGNWLAREDASASLAFLVKQCL
ncbi:MAG: HEAT repeat domain-containing protein [Steroidobacteraceae bacterium]